MELVFSYLHMSSHDSYTYSFLSNRFYLLLKVRIQFTRQIHVFLWYLPYIRYHISEH